MVRIITFERDEALVEGFISPYTVAQDAVAAVRASVGQGDGWSWAELTGSDRPRYSITMPDADAWAFGMRLRFYARDRGVRFSPLEAHSNCCR